MKSRAPAIFVFLAACSVAGVSTGQIDEDTPAEPETVGRAIELIVANHAESPAPQQLALVAARRFLAHSGQPARLGLAARIGKLGNVEEIIAFFEELDESRPENLKRDPVWKNVLLEMVGSCRGQVIPARDAKVNESVSSNRYVGTGIVLTIQDHYPTMAKVIEGGPAARAGAGDGDKIISIDGEDTRDWNVRQSIDALRGPQGSKVSVKLLAPKASEDRAREYTIVRDVVPFQSVDDLQSLGGAGRGIGYVRIKSIRSSTAHELRKIEKAAIAEDLQAIVLDFRNISGGRIHDTVLLANILLDAGDHIGRARSAEGTRDFRAEADRIFRGMPLAILIDSSTSGPGEWLAAALDRNDAAILVGMQTAGWPVARGPFPLPGSELVLNFAHALLEGPGGGPLVPAEKGSGRTNGLVTPGNLMAIPGAARNPGRSSVWPDYPVEIDGRAAERLVLGGQVRGGGGENQLFLDVAIEALRKELEN